MVIQGVLTCLISLYLNLYTHSHDFSPYRKLVIFCDLVCMLDDLFLGDSCSFKKCTKIPKFTILPSSLIELPNLTLFLPFWTSMPSWITVINNPASEGNDTTRLFCTQLPANKRLRTGYEREVCLPHTLLGWCTTDSVGKKRLDNVGKERRSRPSRVA